MSQSPKTRASLILRLRRPDDAAAWTEFVEIYQPLIFRLARNKGGLQEADALDLTQEVLARVANAVNRFELDPEQGSFRGWLNRITRNLVVDFLRGKQRQPITGDHSEVQQLLDNAPAGPESSLFDAEQQRQVFAWAADRIQDQFQAATWEAFWLTAVDDWPVEEVGQRLDMTPGAVYIARSRVMARLKQQVNKHTQFTEIGGRNES
jgi:RNA polymerase sigma factor (sigma-70 family)